MMQLLTNILEILDLQQFKKKLELVWSMYGAYGLTLYLSSLPPGFDQNLPVV